MSARSIKRNHDRSVLKDRRRTVRRAKRASIAAGAALGATVMFAPSAEAATFEVNTLNDAPADGCTTDPDGCTLRDAVAEANAAGGDDVVTFASDLSGTITLTQGEIVIAAYGLSIVDDGTSEVSVSGNDSSRIFKVYNDTSITGLDLLEGYVDGNGGAILVDEYGQLYLDDVTVADSYAASDGGGISVYQGRLEMIDSLITGNTADNEGGGVHLDNKYGISRSALEMTDSEISGNYAGNGGGVLGEKYSDIDIETSEVSGNEASGTGGGVVSQAGRIDIDASEITGNAALQGGGGGVSAKYADLALRDSTVSGNEAAGGAAGVFVAGLGSNADQGPGDGPDTEIRNTTIADNTAVYGAGGVGIAYIGENAQVVVSRSTISGNSAGDGGQILGVGGGVGIYGDTYGEIEFSNSTISGNTAGFGGGVSIDRAEEGDNSPVPRSGDRREVPPEGDGSLEFNNSTIADNAATEQGGGIYLGYYTEYDPDAQAEVDSQSTVPLSSTIVADNTAAGSANDLAEAPGIPGGGFTLNYSLVETPGTASVTQDPAGSSIVGTDPQLGDLADNGGPTLTHLPGASSPAIDQGVDNETARDQRGERRSVDLEPDNNPPNDPTDIGSVEIQTGAPPPVEPETRPLTAEEIPAGCDLTLATAGLALGGTDEGQTIVGSDDDDVLRGFGGADTVVGRGGDDCLTGDDDDDTIRGKSGDDFALGGSDRDFMKGNGGDDEFRGNGGADRIKLAGGNDSGAGGGGEDNIAAGNGEDRIKGNAGDDRMFGNDGDDEIKGGSGDDVIYGGGGVNDINCGSGDDKVIVSGEKDEIAPNCETIKVRGTN